jgi:hypothetical protein
MNRLKLLSACLFGRVVWLQRIFPLFSRTHVAGAEGHFSNCLLHTAIWLIAGLALLGPYPVAARADADAPAAPGRKRTIRTDAYGDPLPPGAVARMGTLRFRADGPFEAIAYSPNGKLLAAAEASAGRIHVWDVASGEKLRTLHWFISQVKGLAFAADGKTLASASTDGTCRLWDVSDVAPAPGR